MILEWMAIVIAGSLGGLLGTLLPSGTNVEWPRPLQLLFGATAEQRPRCHFLAHAGRNTLLGALVAFAAWAGNNPEKLFDATSPSVAAVATAATIGLVGTALLNNLLNASVRAGALERILVTATKRADEEVK